MNKDRLGRDLIAGIVHDLRTPLTAIRGYIDEARRALEEGNDDIAAEMLDTASLQTVYTSELVSDLYEMARLEGSEPPLNLEEVSVRDIVIRAAAGQEVVFRESGRKLYVDLPQDLPVISADRVRLLRLLNNLLDNAREHGRSGGTVTVEARSAGEYVEIAVADDGPGVDAATLRVLFEPYEAGRLQPSTRHGGAGLGLRICRAIAEAHGGDLIASSEPGAGTTITVSLPAPLPVTKK